MGYDERNDIWLFENDLAEYRASDEAKAVSALLTYNDNDYLVKKYKTSKKQLREAFERYWDARNGTGLHYSDTKAVEYGKRADELEAKLYAEQN